MADEQEKERTLGEVFSQGGSRQKESTGQGIANAVGPVARSLSQVLMAGAFEKFGHAFTDTGDVRRDAASADGRLAPWRAQGQKAAGALELRWHTMEYENFQASAVEPYIEAKKSMLANYKQLHADLDTGIWAGPPGPDGQPQMQQLDVTKPADREQLIRLRGQIEKDFYGRNADMDIELYNLAHKFPSNPLINERIRMIATKYSDMLLTATNPQQSLQAEGAAADITAKMMTAETNQLAAQTAAKAAKAPKEPTDLRQVKKHPDIGGAGAMQWLIDSEGGKAIMYGSQGADAHRKAVNAFEQKLIQEDPDLAKEPDKLGAKLTSLEGKIRGLAASLYLKRVDPDMWAESKEVAPWLFDFEKTGGSPDGILGPDDERGYKGERRLSTERKKELFGDWTKHWNEELDKWASDPSNPADPKEAMEHMEEWIKNAIVNGSPGVPNNITIAINEATKELRAELISALIEQGGRTVLSNKFIAEAHPIQSLFSSASGSKRPGGKRGRFLHAQERKRRKGLLKEDN